MTSPRYTYICTRTTADFVVPVTASSQGEFNRKVHNAFQGLVGGVLKVGDLLDRPVQAAVPNHKLCDGSTIQRVYYPELVELLNPGGTEATLPDYTGPVEITEPDEPETDDPGGTTTGGDDGGGNVVTGGRPRYEDDPPIGGTL